MGKPDRRLVLVVGPGRSGTSLIAGMLRNVGCYVPQPEFPSSRANPKGYSESVWVYNFHEQLLAQAGVRYIAVAGPMDFGRCLDVALKPTAIAMLRSWLASQYCDSTRKPILVKDPRTAFFVPLWLRVAGLLDIEVAILSMVRDPQEVIGSQNRYYKPLDHNDLRLRAWTLTTLHGEHVTRRQPRRFFLFEELISDPVRALASLNSTFSLSRECDLSSAADFVEPELYRIRGSISTGSVTAPIMREARRVLAVMTELARNQEQDHRIIEDQLDRLRSHAGFRDVGSKPGSTE